ncbi:MAG: hypothetical protein ACPLRM_02905 [Anaerolineae bacterium]
MADYVSLVRTNYFRVKDLERFKEFCRRYGLSPIDGPSGSVGFMLEGVNEGIPSGYVDETGEYHEVDFFGELSRLLVEGQVAEVREIGNEKMRYLVGCTVAVHSNGERLEVNLNDIYRLAKEKWPDAEMTLCEY